MGGGGFPFPLLSRRGLACGERKEDRAPFPSLSSPLCFSPAARRLLVKEMEQGDSRLNCQRHAFPFLFFFFCYNRVHAVIFRVDDMQSFPFFFFPSPRVFSPGASLPEEGEKRGREGKMPKGKAPSPFPP